MYQKSAVYHEIDPLVTIDESFVSQCMFFKLYANYIYYSRKLFTALPQTTKFYL